jgi:hypothetical protein
MSLNRPLTLMDVACISAFVYFGSSKYAIVYLMRMVVPPVGCHIGVVGTAEAIPRDDKVGFGGEMRLANEEDIDTVEF